MVMMFGEVKPKPVTIEDRQGIIDLRLKAYAVVVELKEYERRIADAEKLRALAQLELEHKQKELDLINQQIGKTVDEIKDKYKAHKDFDLNEKFEWITKGK